MLGGLLPAIFVVDKSVGKSPFKACKCNLHTVPCTAVTAAAARGDDDWFCRGRSWWPLRGSGEAAGNAVQAEGAVSKASAHGRRQGPKAAMRSVPQSQQGLTRRSTNEP